MSPPSLKNSLSDLQHELDTTRRVLERIPEDRLTWKPHPKSMTLGGLGQHIANLLYWMQTTLEQPEYDLASGPSVLGEPADREEILQRFETNAVSDSAALAAGLAPVPWKSLKVAVWLTNTAPVRLSESDTPDTSAASWICSATRSSVV